MALMGHFNPARIPGPEVIAREQHVLELRRAGLSFERIAQEVKIPGGRSDAHKIFKRAMARTLQEPAAEIRALEGDRLDRLQAAVWTKALRGDLNAVDRVLRVMERRAKLWGLDHADGIAERALQLEADKVRLVAVGVGRMFDALELTAEQRELGTRVLMEALRAADDADGGTGYEPAEVVQGEVAP